MNRRPTDSDGQVPIDCPVCCSPSHTELYRLPPRRIVQCDGCGHEYVNPVPSRLPVRDYFFAEEEDRSPATEIDLRYLKDVFERYALFGRKLLDLGCGQGRLARGLLEAGWPRQDLYLMDTSEEALARARETLGDTNVALADIQDGIAFAGHAFDCILMVEFLEDLPAPDAVLRRCTEALSPGGTLIVRGLPNNRSLEAFLGGDRWKMRALEKHYQFFNPATFSRCLERHPSLELLEFGCFLQPGFSFYDAARIARDLGISVQAPDAAACARPEEQGLSPEMAVAELLELLRGADYRAFPLREKLPLEQLARLSTPEEVQELFDALHLDFELAPDLGAVMRKG